MLHARDEDLLSIDGEEIIAGRSEDTLFPHHDRTLVIVIEFLIGIAQDVPSHDRLVEFFRCCHPAAEVPETFSFEAELNVFLLVDDLTHPGLRSGVLRVARIGSPGITHTGNAGTGPDLVNPFVDSLVRLVEILVPCLGAGKQQVGQAPENVCAVTRISEIIIIVSSFFLVYLHKVSTSSVE